MTSRPLALALAVASAASLAACTSSSSPARSGSSGHTSAGTPASPAATDAATLGRRIQQAAAGIRTAHLDLSIQAAGQSLTGSGDEQLPGGRLAALDVSMTVPGAGALRVIYAGGKTYAKLPPSLSTSTKPYLVVSPTSSNPLVRSVAGSLQTALAATSIDSYRAFVEAARSVTPKGREQVGGVSATHYSVVVDVSQLPASTPAKRTLLQAGINTLPVELWVDDQGRPVQASQDMTVEGQQVSDKVTFVRFNQPVSITAPPAAEVGI